MADRAEAAMWTSRQAGGTLSASMRSSVRTARTGAPDLVT
jgi:hypothetical protein